MGTFLMSYKGTFSKSRDSCCQNKHNLLYVRMLWQYRTHQPPFGASFAM